MIKSRRYTDIVQLERNIVQRERKGHELFRFISSKLKLIVIRSQMIRRRRRKGKMHKRRQMNRNIKWIVAGGCRKKIWGNGTGIGAKDDCK